MCVSQFLVEYGEKYNENPLSEKRNHRNMITSNCLITENKMEKEFEKCSHAKNFGGMIDDGRDNEGT